MNRLYWKNANNHWELVIEAVDEKLVWLQAEHLVTTNPVRGVCGYAYWPDAPAYMQWTAYHRYEGGCSCSRRPTNAADVPKPIRLLEMLNENATP